MSCQNFDWNGYALQELAGSERQRHEDHLKTCAECRAEAGALSATLSLVAQLPQAEPPRRIAFVSDPVLEPKWWQKLFAPAPGWAFAGASMIAAAVLGHGVLTRPVPVASGPAPVVNTMTAEQVESKIQSEVARRVSAYEMRQREEMTKLVADLKKDMGGRFDQDLKRVKMAADSLEYFEKQYNSLYLASIKGDN